MPIAAPTGRPAERATRRGLAWRAAGWAGLGAALAACAPGPPAETTARQHRQVTLTFWGTNNPTTRTWWRAAVVAGVERRWPHITVDDETPAGVAEKVFAAVAAGTPPDAVVMDSPYLADLASKGALLELDGRVRAEKVDLSDFLPYHVEAARWGGKQYGLCAFGGFHHPGYNQTLGQAAGLADPLQEDARGAWTWARYVEHCARLTARAGEGADPYGTSRGTWQMWVINNGGNVLNAERTELTLDRPEALEALQFWVDLVRRHRVAPSDAETSQQPESARWNAGRLGFFYNVRGGLGSAGVDIRDGFRWGVVPVPRGKTRKAHLNSNGQTFAFRATAHPDDAFRFVWGWSGREGQIARLDAGDPLTPSLKSVAFSPAFLNQTVRAEGKPDFPVPPNFNQFWADQMRQGNVEGIPVHPKLPQILAEVNKGLTEAMAGAKGVGEAVAGVKGQVAALLR